MNTDKNDEIMQEKLDKLEDLDYNDIQRALFSNEEDPQPKNNKKEEETTEDYSDDEEDKYYDDDSEELEDDYEEPPPKKLSVSPKDYAKLSIADIKALPEEEQEALARAKGWHPDKGDLTYQEFHANKHAKGEAAQLAREMQAQRTKLEQSEARNAELAANVKELTDIVKSQITNAHKSSADYYRDILENTQDLDEYRDAELKLYELDKFYSLPEKEQQETPQPNQITDEQHVAQFRQANHQIFGGEYAKAANTYAAQKWEQIKAAYPEEPTENVLKMINIGLRNNEHIPRKTRRAPPPARSRSRGSEGASDKYNVDKLSDFHKDMYQTLVVDKWAPIGTKQLDKKSFFDIYVYKTKKQ